MQNSCKFGWQVARDNYHIHQITFDEFLFFSDGYVQSMLCVPIVSINSGNVIAVACVFNKTLPEKRYTIHRNVDFYVITVSVIAFLSF